MAGPEDIPLLASHFIQRLSHKMDIRNIRLTQGDVSKLQSYDWPGNVRELENVIERAIIASRQGRLNIEIPENNLISKTEIETGDFTDSDQKKYLAMYLFI